MSKTTNSIVKPTFVPSQDDPCPCSLLVESRRTWSNPDMSFHVKDTKIYCGNLKFVHQAILIMFLGLTKPKSQVQVPMEEKERKKKKKGTRDLG